MAQSKIKDTFAFCLGVLLLGGLIQAAGALKGDALVFPGVDEILRAFFRLITTGKTYALIWTTMKHLLLSLAVSTAVGVGLGLAQGLSPFVRNLLRPLMIMLRSLPMVILIVIIMVLCEYSKVPVIAACAVLIPLISEAACEGCLQIDRELIDVYRMNANFNGRVLIHVYLPLMGGYIRQAYVNAVGMGIKLTVSSEYLVQARDSLGKAVHTSGYFNEYQDIYAYALVMILLVLIVSEGPVWIGKCISCRKQRKSAS